MKIQKHWKTKVFDVLTDIRDRVKIGFIVDMIDHMRYEWFYVIEDHYQL